jgi:hypothetical protein
VRSLLGSKDDISLSFPPLVEVCALHMITLTHILTTVPGMPDMNRTDGASSTREGALICVINFAHVVHVQDCITIRPSNPWNGQFEPIFTFNERVSLGSDSLRVRKILVALHRCNAKLAPQISQKLIYVRTFKLPSNFLFPLAPGPNDLCSSASKKKGSVLRVPPTSSPPPPLEAVPPPLSMSIL